MSRWTHPQALAALVAAVYAALTPIWTNNPTDSSKGTATIITLGVITTALALFDLALPGRIAFEGLIALMGVLFILSPWVMSFTAVAYRPMAWTAWLVGIVALVAGAADVQMTHTEQRSHGVVTQ